MKGNFLENEQVIKEEIENETLIMIEKELNPKKKFNFKFWIIILFILDIISFVLLIIFRAMKKNIFWLFAACTIIFSLSLIVLIVLKIKRDKREQEEENKKKLEFEVKIKKQQEEESRKQKEEELRKQKEEELRKQKEEELRKQQEEESRKQKEEEKLNEMKKKMLENQKKMRETKENSENMTENQKNLKINKVLEDMCIYGAITKKEIKKEKKRTSRKICRNIQSFKHGKSGSRIICSWLNFTKFRKFRN